MEKSRLRPELQSIVEQFAKFRNKYSSLKTHYVAQEELICLQKIELEKMNSRMEQLATVLIDYQRRFNVTMRNLESENQRLRKIVDDSRDKDNEYILDIHRVNNEHIRSLEEDLTDLRSQINTINEKHQEQIVSMKKLHDEEITLYKQKLAHCNTPERRNTHEISINEKKIVEKNTTVEKSISSRKKPFAHPALDDSTECKRKKTHSAAFRWPKLDFIVNEKESGSTQPSAKKKKLYQADNDTIVDLTF